MVMPSVVGTFLDVTELSSLAATLDVVDPATLTRDRPDNANRNMSNGTQ
jgi:hypothetical protein